MGAGERGLPARPRRHPAGEPDARLGKGALSRESHAVCIRQDAGHSGLEARAPRTHRFGFADTPFTSSEAGLKICSTRPEAHYLRLRRGEEWRNQPATPSGKRQSGRLSSIHGHLFSMQFCPQISQISQIPRQTNLRNLRNLRTKTTPCRLTNFIDKKMIV